MGYFNAQGQGRVGWRSSVVAPTPVTVSTLLTSLYSVWNADTTSSTLDSSIYGAWNGENNANDSVGTNHGTLMNGCTFTTGKLGQAFTFDGVNDYIEYPANSMNLTGDFTISFWGYMRTRDTNVIMSNIGNDGINRGFYIDSDGSYSLRFVANYLAPYYSLIKTDNSALFDLNVWNHYTFICKNGVGQWYKNGVANGVSGTVMTNGYITNNKPIIGGYRSGNVGTVGSNKNMALDAFTIWNKSLSQDEITQLYNLGTGTQYPFSGQTLPSANNQFAIDNATLMNGCTFTDGKIGKAFTFDGVNDYIQLPNNSLNLTNNYSINLWLYLSSIPNSTLLSVFGNDGTNKGFYIDLTNLSSYTFRFVGFNNGTNVIALNGSGGIGYLNRWSMATLTVSGTSVKIYLDGSLSASGTMTSPINYISTTYPTLGAYRSGNGTPSSYLANGTKIDGLSVWQKELTQAEVTELYNSGAGKQLTVATPIVANGLLFNYDVARVGSYPETGAVLYDNSGNNNHMTLLNQVLPSGSTSGSNIGYVNTGIKRLVFNYSAGGSNGSNSYGRVPLSTTIDSNGYTFGGWIQNIPGGGYTFQKGMDSVYGGWAITMIVGDNGAAMGIINASSQYLGVGSNLTLTNNQWYYVVGQYVHNTALKIYVNGVLANTVNQTTTQISLRNSPGWTISGVASNIQGKSVVSTFHSYNRILTDSEILQNFNANKTNYGY